MISPQSIQILFPLELPPLVQAAELEPGVNIPVHIKVSELMRECEKSNRSAPFV